jgi:hypothetical protein
MFAQENVYEFQQGKQIGAQAKSHHIPEKLATDKVVTSPTGFQEICLATVLPAYSHFHQEELVKGDGEALQEAGHCAAGGPQLMAGHAHCPGPLRQLHQVTEPCQLKLTPLFLFPAKNFVMPRCMFWFYNLIFHFSSQNHPLPMI